MDKLKELKKQYNSVRKNVIDNNKELKKLLKDEKVKKYIELIDNNIKLKNTLSKIDYDYKDLKMRNCNHIFITTKKHFYMDLMAGNEVYEDYYCPKCGLEISEYLLENSFLSPEEIHMKNIYISTSQNAIYLDRVMEKDMVIKLYKDIKKDNPNITDEDLEKYFMYKFDLQKQKTKIFK